MDLKNHISFPSVSVYFSGLAVGLLLRAAFCARGFALRLEGTRPFCRCLSAGVLCALLAVARILCIDWNALSDIGAMHGRSFHGLLCEAVQEDCHQHYDAVSRHYDSEMFAVPWM